MTTQTHSRFSWNLGGFLGSAIGCSAWIILTPFVAGWHSIGVVSALGCAAIILLAVPVLWRMREKIEPLKGMMIFLMVAFLATTSFLLIGHFMRLPILASWPPPQQAAALNYFWILLLFPALALLFWFIGRPTKSNSEQGSAHQSTTAP
jgi:hypothetical protein